MTNYWILFMSSLLIIIYIIMNNNKNIHPIYMILLIMIYTITITLIMSMWSPTYIFSIMLFLIMISGLLIMFLYFASLISNEKSKIKIFHWTLMIFLMNFSLIIYAIYTLNPTSTPMMPHSMYPLFMTKYSFLNTNPQPFMNISLIYMYPWNYITLLSMFFLLVTLFSIIKICSKKSFSLRKIS
uniref:Cytochrome b n=1 Tax=Meranoplus bicolor TaxID=611886 RepID=A0A8K1RCP4_9HYME|nr:cytochrome b [Meranoplus bicolor]